MKTYPVDRKEKNEEGSHLREGTGEIIGTCVAFLQCGHIVGTLWKEAGDVHLLTSVLVSWGYKASSGPHRGPSQSRQVTPVK